MNDTPKMLTPEEVAALENSPVLPDARNIMHIELAVNEKGKVYIFHAVPFIEPVSWIEYDPARRHVFLIGENGRIQDMGINVPHHMNEAVAASGEICVALVEGGRITDAIYAPLIIQGG